MYAILFWEDSTFTVIALRTIVSPRKEIKDYVVGEEVKATFRGKTYSAHIYEISDDRSELNQKLKTGIKIDFERIPLRGQTEQEKDESKVTREPVKKRHKSSDDLPKAKEVRKRRKTDGAISSEKAPVEEPSEDPLVKQAMEILAKRRTLTSLTTPPEVTFDLDAQSIHENDIVHTRPAPETVLDNSTPEVTMSIPGQEQSTDFYTASLLADSMRQDYNQQWQSELHEPTYLQQPQVREDPQPQQMRVDSFMSLLNSNDQQQISTQCYCKEFIEQLEKRVAELEKQVKIKQHMETKTVSTPIRKPLMEQNIHNISNISPIITPSEVQASGSSNEVHVSEIIRYETRLPKAIAKAMRSVFSVDQLAECSFKGGVTHPGGMPRPGLPYVERDIIIDVVSRKFQVSRSTVETKMRSALYRFHVMYK